MSYSNTNNQSASRFGGYLSSFSSPPFSHKQQSQEKPVIKPLLESLTPLALLDAKPFDRRNKKRRNGRQQGHRKSQSNDFDDKMDNSSSKNFDNSTNIIAIARPSSEQLQALEICFNKTINEKFLSGNSILKRKYLFESIKKSIQQKRSDCQISIYGSVYFECCFERVGIIDIDVKFNETLQYDTLKELLEIVQQAEYCDGAKIDPDHKPSCIIMSTKGDPSIRARLTSGYTRGIHLSKLIRLYTKFDPRTLKLMRLIRYLARMYGIDNVPVTLNEQQHNEFFKACNDYEKSQKWKSKNKTSVEELFLQFLSYYLQVFSTKQFVVSIQTKMPVLKTEKNWHSRKLLVEDPTDVKRSLCQTMQAARSLEYFRSCLRSALLYFGRKQVIKKQKSDSSNVDDNSTDDFIIVDNDDIPTIEPKNLLQSSFKIFAKNLPPSVCRDQTIRQARVKDYYIRLFTKQSPPEPQLKLHKKKSNGNGGTNTEWGNEVTEEVEEAFRHDTEHDYEQMDENDQEDEIQVPLEELHIKEDDEENGIGIETFGEETEQNDIHDGLLQLPSVNEDDPSQFVQCPPETPPLDTFSSINEENDEQNGIKPDDKEGLDLATNNIGDGDNENKMILSNVTTNESERKIVLEKANDMSSASTRSGQENENKKTSEQDADSVESKNIDYLLAQLNKKQKRLLQREYERQGRVLNEIVKETFNSLIKDKPQSATETNSSPISETDIRNELPSATSSSESSTSTQVTVLASTTNQLPTKPSSPLDHIPSALSSPSKFSDEQITLTTTNSEYFYDFQAENFGAEQGAPYVCTTCNSVGHIKSECPELNIPDLVEIPQLSDAWLNKLSSICVDITTNCKPMDSDIELRKKILELLRKLFRKEYSDCELHAFGSFYNGFGFKRSDLDICVTFKDVAEDDAIENTRLLNTYTLIDPRVAQLGYMLKFLAKKCEIGDASRGTLSSYAYIIMVIHFLQQTTPPVLPVLQLLCKNDNAKSSDTYKKCGKWNVYFYEDMENLSKVWKDRSENLLSVGALWIEFLRYYTETFNYEEHIVSIRKSEPLTRWDKGWFRPTLAVEDPFELSHNLAAGLSVKNWALIRRVLIRARKAFALEPQLDISNATFADLEPLLFNIDELCPAHAPKRCEWCRGPYHIRKRCPKIATLAADQQREKQQTRTLMAQYQQTQGEMQTGFHHQQQQQLFYHSQPGYQRSTTNGYPYQTRTFENQQRYNNQSSNQNNFDFSNSQTSTPNVFPNNHHRPQQPNPNYFAQQQQQMFNSYYPQQPTTRHQFQRQYSPRTDSNQTTVVNQSA
ncbi:unnamed protein product [Didymodactylos carnosus]|nr:unnamed protein product [Didymodactylos carnosus]CAF3698377.1 unnamed protein product [Didymodactylos carnosus]